MGNFIATLIVISILLFPLVQQSDDYVLQAKHQIATHIMHRYLDRMRIEGRLSTGDENEIKSKLNNVNCKIDSDTNTYINANAKERLLQPRILRGTETIDSELTLEIKCRPEPQPFKPRSLVGGTSTPVYIKVGGKELSERIDP
ncbi:conserved hypothetical protein [Desulforamulus reducens MI-1]|uniref:Uncharacterized protein n=1 Tax=Desulforamulus reducens (strain ATCC BAA-1160 / DSM 100696 / MI-1) TaxID=349161 RepID=A4J341_DESRM|nr:hypothetical protein [Desulforamulus reducens]ABO49494.1 conserved hypothetical protein [Desulforamulus reducens MI-1]